jgi:hypothetical protein
MYQQCFNRVAGCRIGSLNPGKHSFFFSNFFFFFELIFLESTGGGESMYLGIQNTANGLLTIGILVNINVAEPVGMAQDGDLGMILYVLHQFLAPAGDDEVDELVLL